MGEPSGPGRRPWRSGDNVVIREVWRGRVFAARAVIVVRDDPDLQIFYRPEHSPSARAVDANGRELRIPDRDWTLQPAIGGDREILSFAFADEPYAVLIAWQGGAFWGWYVNLQEPLRKTSIGFDTVDHVLDVLIPAGSSRSELKDEDELEQAVRLGLFSPDEAARFRDGAERGARHVVSRRAPFDVDWLGWQPDRSWPVPELPPGWDVVQELAPA